jgi:hypothetical protein
MSDSLLLTAELQNKIKNETSSWNDRFFRALEEKVHEALARQDSDLALAIITR